MQYDKPQVRIRNATGVFPRNPPTSDRSHTTLATVCVNHFFRLIININNQHTCTYGFGPIKISFHKLKLDLRTPVSTLYKAEAIAV